MRKIFVTFFVVVALMSCSENKDYDEVPQPIITFITKYWPNPIIEEYSHPSPQKYEVDIKNGPSLDFDGNYLWTEVDGEGMPLPEIFLYDQLPSDLYDYLQAGSYTNDVFEVERTSKTYSLELLNINIYYDIQTGRITQN